MSKFQVILLCVFGAFILVAVLLFSLSKGSTKNVASVLIWGDIPQTSFDSILAQSGVGTDKTVSITYQAISKDNFDSEFTEALAEGKGPDLIIIPLDKLWKNRNKIIPMSYQNVNQGDFIDTFIEEGEMFMTAEGVYALPVTIDPLVLYWNRDLFTKASLAKPPVYWDEIFDFAKNLTKKDGAGNITTSAITLGESRNIPHAKDILSMLMLQAGTPITSFVGGELRAQLLNNFNLTIVPGQAAVDFYTQFANPGKVFYSWNRSLKPAQTAFVGGSAAMYVGYASELNDLKTKNPNLNLGVAVVPQSRVSGKAVTFGQMRGIAISRSTINSTAAYNVALKFVSQGASKAFANVLGLPPVRRDLLSQKPTDATQSVFYSAALQSEGWRDPDDEKTDQIFKELIDSITSGRARLQEAVIKANDEIDLSVK